MGKPHTCPECNGAGEKDGARCRVCQGKRVVFEPDEQAEAAATPSEEALDLTYRRDE